MVRCAVRVRFHQLCMRSVLKLAFEVKNWCCDVVRECNYGFSGAYSSVDVCCPNILSVGETVRYPPQPSVVAAAVKTVRKKYVLFRQEEEFDAENERRTHVDLQNFLFVFQPFLRQHFNINASLDCRRRGWFPRGGGVVCLTTNPVRFLPSINVIDPGNVVRIRGVSMVSEWL